MTTNGQIPSAFWEERFDTGIHVCQLFSDEEDRLESMTSYMASGIEAGQKCRCCTFDDAQPALGAYFQSSGLSLDDACACGQLSFVEADRVWLADGRFDPELLLSRLTDFRDSADGEGWRGVRIIAEISPAIPEMPGGGRLIEFEVEVNRLFHNRPMSMVCQYDLRRFNGAILMDVLRVHPFIMIRGSVMPNPFYLPADDARAAA
jgi:MEDS: MEthanogen/methylotroph, DcmR Sensory domain